MIFGIKKPKKRTEQESYEVKKEESERMQNPYTAEEEPEEYQ
jgi:hypothetical protein